MIKNKNKLPLVNENNKLSKGIKVMNKCKLGTLIALNSMGHLTGVISDGDIRRASKKI